MKRVTYIYVLFAFCLFVKAESINYAISDGIDSLAINPKMKMVGNVSIPPDLYETVIKNDVEQSYCQHRKKIYASIEKIISAYNKGDFDLLKEGMSYSTIIGWSESDKPEVRKWGLRMKQSFDQYYDHLELVYKKKKGVIFFIDDIEVMCHPVNPFIYGVTIKMGWKVDREYDEGYLFQLWDFSNEDAPQIHVCTWQPDKIGGKPLPKDEVFSLSDFDI